MPSYMVTCKDGASPDEVKEVKQHLQDQGGNITHEYKLIKGFAVTFDEDNVSTLGNHPHIENVENDGEAKTQ